MRPGRFALTIVAAVGLSLAALAMWRPAPSEAETHHRVRLELSPVDSALWFAATFPHYFTTGEARLEPWLDTLDTRDREFVLAMAQTLVWTWVEHELVAFEARDIHEPRQLGDSATTVVRSKTLNQLEYTLEPLVELENIDFSPQIGDPYFAAGVFARLVRGSTNCEGQNHLVAVLLDAALESSSYGPRGLEAHMIAIPEGHDVVRVTGLTLAQPIFVDAWSNLPAFTTNPERRRDAPLLQALGDSPPPVVPGLAGRAPLPAEAYTRFNHDEKVSLVPGRTAPTKGVSLDIQAPPLDDQSLASEENPWQLYLYARISHIYDDPRAARLYRFILEHHCESNEQQASYVCLASTLMSTRLSLLSVSEAG